MKSDFEIISRLVRQVERTKFYLFRDIIRHAVTR